MAKKKATELKRARNGAGSVQHLDNGKVRIFFMMPANPPADPADHAQDFARRYADMPWSILTPEICAHFDGSFIATTSTIRNRSFLLLDQPRNGFEPVADVAVGISGRQAWKAKSGNSWDCRPDHRT